jgi:hypothetical protein
MTHDPLRAYDYVNHPYRQVRQVLLEDAIGLFQRATTVATSRAASLHAQIHARLGPLDVAADVAIRVTSVEEVAGPLGAPATRVTLDWSAVRHPGVFPVMHAVLMFYALSNRETQLELEGTYEPPLGLVGKAVDALVGRRIADASVLCFVQEVAARLREELAAPSVAALK